MGRAPADIAWMLRSALRRPAPAPVRVYGPHGTLLRTLHFDANRDLVRVEEAKSTR
jgi:hypothetical protein